MYISFVQSMYFIVTSLLVICVLSQNIEYDSAIANECSVTFSSTGSNVIPVTYDLCPLKLSSEGQITDYTVKDSRYGDRGGYVYKFNIGDVLPISSIPDICINQTVTPGYCINNQNCFGTNIVDIIDEVWAYQIYQDANKIETECYHLSNEAGGPPSFTLLNPADPTEGVKLTYLNGDYEPHKCQTNRIFNIEFICENNVNFIPKEQPIYEKSPCEYTLSIRSIYGCPAQCNRYDNEVCGAHGLCGYDFMSTTPRCFCYWGWDNNDCMTQEVISTHPYESTKPLPEKSVELGFTNIFSAEETGSVEVAYDLIDFIEDSGNPTVNNHGIYMIHNRNKQFQVIYIGLAPIFLPKYDPNSLLPIFCNNITMPCDDIDEITGTCLQFRDPLTVAFGFVFLVDYTENSESCVALSIDIPQWQLYDAENPARGVTILYANGSFCEQGRRNREYRTHLVCPMSQDVHRTTKFDAAEETSVDVYEYLYTDDIYDCTYSGTLETAVACPWQCITETDVDDIKEFTVCSQHGICAADPYAGFVRCLCDVGYDTDFYCRNETNAPTQLPTIAPIESASDSDENDTNINGSDGERGGFVVSIIILICLMLLLVIVGGICLKKLKLKNSILQQRVDDQDYVKFASDAQGNTHVDDKGNRGFATIPNPTAAGAEDNDSDADQSQNSD